MTNQVWYVAYGSNLALARFTCYLSGGQPPGGARMYPGCRNPTAPARSAGVLVPGGLAFAGASKVWGGGSAFYNPAADGELAGRAYLLTADQFADVAAQEMWREPGGAYALAVAAVLPSVTTLHSVGDGRYETVVRLGELDGLPMYTITHGTIGVPVAPAESYLRWIATGLVEAHGWDAERVASYLHAAPGVGLGWTLGALMSLLDGGAGGGG
ncbi:histone deacetylase [Kribbella sp. NPDC004536]|uniref:histone deacetylase n=1 Tax=Kribbella sp. NPDC004536 TaxID=3364106 RepID=UPI003692A33B